MIFNFYILVSSIYLLFFPFNLLFSNDVEFNYIYYTYVILCLFSIFLARKFRFKINFNEWLTSPCNFSFFIFNILILLTLLYIYFFTSIDYSLILKRTNRELLFFRTQFWVVYCFIFFCFSSNVFFHYKKLSNINKKIFIINFLLFICLETILLGGRRISTYIVINLIFSYYYLYNPNLKIKKIIILLVMLLISILFYGVYRESLYFNESSTNILKSVLTSNEFTAVGWGLYKILYDGFDSFSIGYTYIEAILKIIPREIYLDKPISLAHKYNITISPYTESFINFNIFGFIPIFIFSIIFNTINNMKDDNYYKILTYSIIIEYNRSDFAGILYLLIIVFFIRFILFSKKY